MSFVDYYGVLNIARHASVDDVYTALEAIYGNVTPAHYELAMEGRVILTNPYKRARYDKDLGFLLVIQSESEPYLSGTCYQLSLAAEKFAAFRGIKQSFYDWLLKKFGYDEEEAEAANYGYSLMTDVKNPYLVLRFPHSRELEIFAKTLLDARRIKASR